MYFFPPNLYDSGLFERLRERVLQLSIFVTWHCCQLMGEVKCPRILGSEPGSVLELGADPSENRAENLKYVRGQFTFCYITCWEPKVNQT